MNTNQILNYLSLIKPRPEWALDEKLINNIIPDVIINPKKLDQSMFGYDEVTNTIINPKCRYISNSSAFEARDYLLEQKRRPKTDNKLNTRDVVLGGHSRMFKLLASQERLSNAEVQICGLLFSKQELSEYELSKATGNPGEEGPRKYGADLVAIQVLAKLLEKHELFPYTTSNGRTYVNDYSKDFSCTLPQIIITLLNIGTAELLGIYTHEFAILAVEYMFERAKVSICQDYLTYGGLLRDLESMLYLKMDFVNTIVRSKEGVPNGIASFENFKDWDYENKYKELRSKISKLRGIDLKIWNYIWSKREGNGTQLATRIRYLKMWLNSVTTNSIYNKTSLLLEYEKSAAPVQKVRTGMNCQH